MNLPHKTLLNTFDLENIGLSDNLKGWNNKQSVHVEISYHVGKNQFLIEIQPMAGKFFYHLGHSLDYLIAKCNVELDFRGISDKIVLTDEQKLKLNNKIKKVIV